MTDWILEIKGHGHSLVQVYGGERIHVDVGVLKSILWFFSLVLSRMLKDG